MICRHYKSVGSLDRNHDQLFLNGCNSSCADDNID